MIILAVSVLVVVARATYTPANKLVLSFALNIKKLSSLYFANRSGNDGESLW